MTEKSEYAQTGVECTKIEPLYRINSIKFIISGIPRDSAAAGFPEIMRIPKEATPLVSVGGWD